jgi:alanyl-tRNA synthetase
MGELYSNIATNYDRVDGSLKSNFELIRDEFDTEKARFQKIMSKEVKKFYNTLERNEMAMPVIKAKELFLAKD